MNRFAGVCFCAALLIAPLAAQSLTLKKGQALSSDGSIKELQATEQSSEAISSRINETTSRFKRTQYMCKVATNEKMKPAMTGRDNFLISDALFVYADLYGDGSLELIAGNFDEAHKDASLEGNELRSREPHQYMIFSPNTDFVVPKDTNFIMARVMLVQDFNADGIDDVVFVQHGPDYKPYVKQPNKILLSADGDYVVKTLPGPKALYHGGSAGDIDNDGDVDIVATPGEQNRTVYYLNDGKGNFSYKVFLGKNGTWKTTKRYYNSLLWDIDADGMLDLVLGGHRDPAGKGMLPPVVHWGKRGGSFSSPFEKKAQVLSSNIYGDMMQDAAVSDVDGDGKADLIFLNSDPKSEKPEATNHFNYFGFSFVYYTINGREISEPKPVASYQTRTQAYLWLARFSECDLGNDGDTDFVFESHGERFWTSSNGGSKTPENDQWGIDKLLWINDGKGNFELKKVFDPQYWHESEEAGLRDAAKRFGVSISKYQTNQVYYPTDDGETYYKLMTGFHVQDRQRIFGDIEERQKSIDTPIVKNSTAVVDYSKPEYMTPIKELCAKAVSDLNWNKLAPNWAALAQERGLTVDDCKKFTGSNLQ